MRIKINKKLSAFLRVFIALALLGFLFYSNKDNFSDVLVLLKNIIKDFFSYGYFLIIGFIIYFLNVSIESIRWKGLLASKGIKTKVSYLLTSVYIGFFFNNLLPTSVGGDAYRAIDVHKKYKASLSANISAIMIGRFLNIITGFMFLIFSLIAGMYKILDRYLIISLTVMIPVIFFMTLVVFFPSIFKVDRLFRKIKFLNKFESGFKNFVDVLESYKKNKVQLLIAFLFSVIIVLFWYSSYYFIALSLGIDDTPYVVFLFILPLSSAVANLPISFGGMGVRENAIVFLFSYFGVSSEKALALSLLILGSNLVIAFLGGILYLGKKVIMRSGSNP
jgi:glycosyltransferase 2 family protein